MPELPEVEMVRRYAEERCKGRTITNVRVLDEGILDGVSRSIFVQSIQGRQIIGASRHGKQLFLNLRKGFITVHLGMTGDLLMLERGERPPSHARTLFTFDDTTRLVYDDPRKFGALGLTSSMADFVREHRLGPDALKVSKKEFVARAQRSHRAIKSVLLDQHVIAGVGNLYADESLFQSKIHPLVASNELPVEALERIWAQVRHVLNASIRVSTDFQMLPEGFLLRSRAAGSPCNRGNGILHSIKVGGRTTIFCPACQKLI
jgi:formamidopyrimidine-DNA glycosylase